jgi:hypothetical protein
MGARPAVGTGDEHIRSDGRVIDVARQQKTRARWQRPGFELVLLAG